VAVQVDYWGTGNPIRIPGKQIKNSYTNDFIKYFNGAKKYKKLYA